MKPKTDIKRWLTRRICDYEIAEGSIPPWWMGLAYCRTPHWGVFWIVPLHEVVKLLWWLNDKWCRYRLRPSWIDREAMKRATRNAELHEFLIHHPGTQALVGGVLSND